MTALTRRAFVTGMTATGSAFAMPALGSGLAEVGGAALGTYWRVRAGAAPGRIEALAEDVLTRVDRAMSPYRRDSELTGFNADQSREPIALSLPLATVTRAALAMSRATGGAFDPTVGPNVARLGFGPIRGDRSATWRELRLARRYLRKTRPGVTLDLCGIAKGYAVDALAARLDANGLDDWLIDFGGELRGKGRSTFGRAWRVGIARPFQPDGQALAAFELKNEAVATSGPGEQSYKIGARRVGHLIQPATGAAASRGLSSVTVIAPTAMQADALATALAVMEPARGVSWAVNHGVAAVFFGESGLRMTGGFKSRLLL